MMNKPISEDKNCFNLSEQLNMVGEKRNIKLIKSHIREVHSSIYRTLSRGPFKAHTSHKPVTSLCTRKYLFSKFMTLSVQGIEGGLWLNRLNIFVCCIVFLGYRFIVGTQRVFPVGVINVTKDYAGVHSLWKMLVLPTRINLLLVYTFFSSLTETYLDIGRGEQLKMCCGEP